MLLVAGACDRRDRAAEISKAAVIEVRARGNEPFWAVDISSSAIVYRTPELLPDSLGFPLVTPVSDSGSHAWTTTASGRTLTLRVTRGNCQDTMSGQDFAWSAVIEMDSTSATGCANVTE
jgi:putative lipoprotein